METAGITGKKLFQQLSSLKSVISTGGSATANESNNAQDIQIRSRLLNVSNKENLFVVVEAYSGFGLTNSLHLNVDDVVYVLKKSDPCGNNENWFVDNGGLFFNL